jgi:hypothetical protein
MKKQEEINARLSDLGSVGSESFYGNNSSIETKKKKMKTSTTSPKNVD